MLYYYFYIYNFSIIALVIIQTFSILNYIIKYLRQKLILFIITEFNI